MVKNGTKMVQKWYKNGTKWYKNGTKMVQKWYKNSKKWYKNGTQMVKNGTKMVKNGTKMVQKWYENGTKWYKNGTKIAQNGTKMVQKGYKKKLKRNQKVCICALLMAYFMQWMNTLNVPLKTLVTRVMKDFESKSSENDNVSTATELTTAAESTENPEPAATEVSPSHDDLTVKKLNPRSVKTKSKR